jgi:hypothetical protein
MAADLEKASTPFLKSRVKTHYQSIIRMAKMMNRDPETFTDKDIKEAIRYLLPTSLFAQDARPSMKHPFEIYHTHMLETDNFTEDGKPKAAAFFTGASEYFDLIYEIYQQQEQVRQVAKNKQRHDLLGYSAGNEVDSAQPVDIDTPHDQNKEDAEEFEISASEDDSTAGSSLHQQYGPTRWLKKDEMSFKLSAKLSDQQYEGVIERLENLLYLPHSAVIKDFLMGFRKEIPPVMQYDKEQKVIW